MGKVLFYGTSNGFCVLFLNGLVDSRTSILPPLFPFSFPPSSRSRYAPEKIRNPLHSARRSPLFSPFFPLPLPDAESAVLQGIPSSRSIRMTFLYAYSAPLPFPFFFFSPHCRKHSRAVGVAHHFLVIRESRDLFLPSFWPSISTGDTLPSRSHGSVRTIFFSPVFFSSLLSPVSENTINYSRREVPPLWMVVMVRRAEFLLFPPHAGSFL